MDYDEPLATFALNTKSLKRVSQLETLQVQIAVATLQDAPLRGLVADIRPYDLLQKKTGQYQRLHHHDHLLRLVRKRLHGIRQTTF